MCIPVDLQLKLFDSIVLPIPTYSCEDWGFENCAEIEKVKFTILQENIKSKTNDFKLHGLRGIRDDILWISTSMSEWLYSG